jgi:integrase
MDKLIYKYIESKFNAWATTTIRSESARLNGVAHVLDGDPDKLWKHLQGHKPYARLTTWTRVVQFYNWLIEQGLYKGVNKYEQWKKTNQRQFKNCYTKSFPKHTFQQARDLILSQQEWDDGTRNACLQMLTSGVRTCELGTVREDAGVIGKGGKRRQIFTKLPGRIETDYIRIYRALKTIGLTPHQLRKLFLNRLIEKGANLVELKEIAGWSSIVTADSYVKANEQRLSTLVMEAMKDE